MITYFDRKNISESRLHSGKEKSFLDTIVFEDFSFLNCNTREVLKEECTFNLGPSKGKGTKQIKANASDDVVSGPAGSAPNKSEHSGCGRIKGAPLGKASKLKDYGCIDLVVDFNKQEIVPDPSRNGRGLDHSERKLIFDYLVGFVAYATNELEAYHKDNNKENDAKVRAKAEKFNSLDSSKMKEYIKQGKEMVK